MRSPVQPLTDEQAALVRRAVAEAFRPVKSFAEILDQSDDSVTAYLVGEILDILHQAADRRFDEALAYEQRMVGVNHG